MAVFSFGRTADPERGTGMLASKIVYVPSRICEYMIAYALKPASSVEAGWLHRRNPILGSGIHFIANLPLRLGESLVVTTTYLRKVPMYWS